MVYIKLKNTAALQKVIGYAIVIMAAYHEKNPLIVILGCAIGITLSEMADMWYELVIKYQKAVKKERLIKVGKP